MSAETSSVPSRKIFPQTRWTVVLTAGRAGSPGSTEALEEICRLYWQPLYIFARSSGRSPQDAEDLTQSFFCRLLEKGWLKTVDPARGRLRTFLITALKRFMANEWDRNSAKRRGEGKLHAQIDTTFAESSLAHDHKTLG